MAAAVAAAPFLRCLGWDADLPPARSEHRRRLLLKRMPLRWMLPLRVLHAPAPEGGGGQALGKVEEDVEHLDVSPLGRHGQGAAAAARAHEYLRAQLEQPLHRPRVARGARQHELRHAVAIGTPRGALVESHQHGVVVGDAAVALALALGDGASLRDLELCPPQLLVHVARLDRAAHARVETHHREVVRPHAVGIGQETTGESSAGARLAVPHEHLADERVLFGRMLRGRVQRRVGALVALVHAHALVEQKLHNLGRPVVRRRPQQRAGAAAALLDGQHAVGGVLDATHAHREGGGRRRRRGGG